MQQFNPPHALPDPHHGFSIFLAGSIEMGMAENWQNQLIKALQHTHAIFFNPRRTDWDATWQQEKTNRPFLQQVQWELSALEQADLIIFYFDPNTKSPVSLLELGLHAKSGKCVVCCPEGFWRKGNVDIVCDTYGITQVQSLQAIVHYIEQRIA